jgi:hypothetical protein
MLAIVVVSLVGILASTPILLQGTTPGAAGLCMLRLGLCILLSWYLLSRGVRMAFRSQPVSA